MGTIPFHCVVVSSVHFLKYASWPVFIRVAPGVRSNEATITREIPVVFPRVVLFLVRVWLRIVMVKNGETQMIERQEILA